VFQPRAGVLEHALCFAQQLDAARSAFGEAGGAQGYPECARAVVGLGERRGRVSASKRFLGSLEKVT